MAPAASSSSKKIDQELRVEAVAALFLLILVFRH